MFNFASSLRIHLCLEAVDMRKSFNGLYAMAKHELGHNPMDGDLYVFSNRRRDRVKILYWDGSGFWVLAKRLEKGTFWWPSAGMAEGRELEIRHEALAMLLNCYRSNCHRIFGRIDIPDSLRSFPSGGTVSVGFLG